MVQPGRHVRVYGFADGHDLVMNDAAGERRLLKDALQDGGGIEGCIGAHDGSHIERPFYHGQSTATVQPACDSLGGTGFALTRQLHAATIA